MPFIARGREAAGQQLLRPGVIAARLRAGAEHEPDDGEPVADAEPLEWLADPEEDLLGARDVAEGERHSRPVGVALALIEVGLPVGHSHLVEHRVPTLGGGARSSPVARLQANPRQPAERPEALGARPDAVGGLQRGLEQLQRLGPGAEVSERGRERSGGPAEPDVVARVARDVARLAPDLQGPPVVAARALEPAPGFEDQAAGEAVAHPPADLERLV